MIRQMRERASTPKLTFSGLVHLTVTASSLRREEVTNIQLISEGTNQSHRQEAGDETSSKKSIKFRSFFPMNDEK